MHTEINKLVEKKRMTPEEAGRLINLVTGSADQGIYADCDFVVEAIFEELSLKQQLFRNLEKIVSPECVLASNTSSLHVESMAEGLQHPERVIAKCWLSAQARKPKKVTCSP